MDAYFGEIRILPYSFAPMDWADCNGQLLTVAQYNALYAVIGNTYGGTYGQTFGLPNLQGRAPMHWGAGPGLTPRSLADNGGVESVAITPLQMPAHSHDAQMEKERSDVPDPGNNYLGTLQQGTSNKTLYKDAPATKIPMAASSVSPSGSGAAHQNMQPYLVMRFCMALAGEWPLRP